MEELPASIQLILIRYFDGSASAEEKARLLAWLRQREEHRTHFNETRDLWLACQALPKDDAETGFALGRLRQRIESGRKRMRLKRVFMPGRRIRAAALWLVLLGAAYWLGNRYSAGSQVSFRTERLITAAQSKGRFVLPDSTVVWLNADSELSYPEHFAGDRREVSLEGGAYFEVAKNRERPFIVRAGAIDVQVTGTCFNVSNYPESRQVETALLSGSVRITGEGLAGAVDLQPGQVLEYRKDECRAGIKTADTRLYADWIKDRIVFDDSRLADILVSMSGRYNVRFDCPETFADSTRLSFTIRQETLEEILNALSRIVPIGYSFADGQVRIYPEE